MLSLRASAQSIAAYRSSSSQPATPNSCPSELVEVWVRSPRAVASLEPGPITWATTIAVTRSRRRDHMPVRQAAGDVKRLGKIPRRRQALERPRQLLHLVLGPARQIGQGASSDLAVFAVAFAQQDRWR